MGTFASHMTVQFLLLKYRENIIHVKYKIVWKWKILSLDKSISGPFCEMVYTHTSHIQIYISFLLS